jgi:hypothetical protein
LVYEYTSLHVGPRSWRVYKTAGAR